VDGFLDATVQRDHALRHSIHLVGMPVRRRRLQALPDHHHPLISGKFLEHNRVEAVEQCTAQLLTFTPEIAGCWILCGDEAEVRVLVDGGDSRNAVAGILQGDDLTAAKVRVF